MKINLRDILLHKKQNCRSRWGYYLWMVRCFLVWVGLWSLWSCASIPSESIENMIKNDAEKTDDNFVIEEEKQKEELSFLLPSFTNASKSEKSSKKKDAAKKNQTNMRSVEESVEESEDLSILLPSYDPFDSKKRNYASKKETKKQVKVISRSDLKKPSKYPQKNTTTRDFSEGSWAQTKMYFEQGKYRIFIDRLRHTKDLKKKYYKGIAYYCMALGTKAEIRTNYVNKAKNILKQVGIQAHSSSQLKAKSVLWCGILEYLYPQKPRNTLWWQLRPFRYIRQKLPQSRCYNDTLLYTAFLYEQRNDWNMATVFYKRLATTPSSDLVYDVLVQRWVVPQRASQHYLRILRQKKQKKTTISAYKKTSRLEKVPSSFPQKFRSSTIGGSILSKPSIKSKISPITQQSASRPPLSPSPAQPSQVEPFEMKNFDAYMDLDDLLPPEGKKNPQSPPLKPSKKINPQVDIKTEIQTNKGTQSENKNTTKLTKNEKKAKITIPQHGDMNPSKATSKKKPPLSKLLPNIPKTITQV